MTTVAPEEKAQAQVREVLPELRRAPADLVRSRSISGQDADARR